MRTEAEKEEVCREIANQHQGEFLGCSQWERLLFQTGIADGVDRAEKAKTENVFYLRGYELGISY